MATLNLTNNQTPGDNQLNWAKYSSHPHVVFFSAQTHIRPIRLIGPKAAPAWDQQSRLLSIQNPLNERTTIQWDNLDREQHRVLGNGGTISHTWDAAGRETLIENRDKNGVGQFVATNTYSQVDNRLTVLEMDGTRATYAYDVASQIVNEARGGTMAYARSYIWDPLGNRIQQYDSGILTAGTFNKANQLTLLTPATGPTTISSYDATGNLILQNSNGALTTQTWSPENRLASFADPAGNSEQFLYSDDGLKKQRTNASGVTLFTYDEAALLLETSSSLALQARYTNSPETWGGLASQSRSGVSSFYGFDSQMSARILVSIAGVITDSYSYKAFGEELQSGSGTVNVYRYGALVLYYRELADLLNAWNRWFKPSIGRWDSPDPIGFDGGSWNLFEVVRNNPVIFVDPTGNRGVCCTVKEWLNPEGNNPICLHGRKNDKGEQLPFFGRGCGANETQALKFAGAQCDDGLRRWNLKRGSNCQFKHGRTVKECEPDRRQRGRRSLENCSDAQLIGLCIVTAALIVICYKQLIPVAIGRREKIPAMLGFDDESD